MTHTAKIERVTGRALAVRGDEIDTDRIIPARFLKAITFDGLEHHLFEDERREATARGAVHPIDVPSHKGVRVLLVQSNFGCGSSREHAPQAIKRWGIHAIVGESFAEIFFGNSMMLGLPCVSASKHDVERLIALSEAQPGLEFEIDLVKSRVTAGDVSVPITMPDSARSSLLSGDWDATTQLVDHYEDVERTAANLPYLSSWAER